MTCLAIAQTLQLRLRLKSKKHAWHEVKDKTIADFQKGYTDKREPKNIYNEYFQKLLSRVRERIFAFHSFSHSEEWCPRSMCTKRALVWSLLVLSVVDMGLGVSSITLGVLGIRALLVQKSQTSYSTPIWSGVCVSKRL